MPGRRPRWLNVAVTVLAVVALVAVVFIAVVHAADRYAVDHASGARIALARYATEGTLYPPLVGDGRFGGTRFMPLPILVHAAAARATGEYLESGKAVAYATMLALGTALVVLRRARCPVSLAWACWPWW
jgi:hypothetical protein